MLTSGKRLSFIPPSPVQQTGSFIVCYGHKTKFLLCQFYFWLQPQLVLECYYILNAVIIFILNLNLHLHKGKLWKIIFL
jgi:hypothetical protein